MSTKNVFKLNDVHDRVVAGTWITYDAFNDPGSLWAWGKNSGSTPSSTGWLGVGPGSHRSSPTQIPGTTWLKLGRGGSSTHAIKSDCTLWGWGYGSVGRLGTNNPGIVSSAYPIQVPGNYWCMVRSFHNNTDRPNTLALKTNNTLWGFGVNDSGELGTNDAISRGSPTQVPGSWCFISAGNSNGFGIKTDGTLWGWGFNFNVGRIGDNSVITRSSPVQIPGVSWVDIDSGNGVQMARKSDGTLWAWGDSTYGVGDDTATTRSSPVQIPGTSWVTTAAGGTVQMARKSDGTMWAWGRNGSGQVGDNTNIHRSSPVQIPGTQWNVLSGGDTKLATKTDGTLWAWGNNSFGILGNNLSGPANIRSSPSQIPGNQWTDIVAGNAYTAFARKSS